MTFWTIFWAVVLGGAFLLALPYILTFIGAVFAIVLYVISWPFQWMMK